MIIRKEFDVESAHRVPQCSTDRCKNSVHGHHGVFEIFLKVNSLDRGAMGIDFGLLKGTVRDFIDSFDHTMIFWKNEPKEFKDFFKKYNARWIEMPISASAEGFALMSAFVIDKIIKNTNFTNNEDTILHSVRYHETKSGWAEADMLDVGAMWLWNLEDIVFSDEIKEDWIDPKMWDKLIEGIRFNNEPVEMTHGFTTVDFEIWKNVEGFSKKYEVSNLGRVRTRIDQNVLMGSINSEGFREYELFNAFSSDVYTGQDLVSQAFLNTEYSAFIATHKDKDKLNNRLENLQIVDKFNSPQIKIYGEPQSNNVSKIDKGDVLEIQARMMSGDEKVAIAKDYGVSLSAIERIESIKNNL